MKFKDLILLLFTALTLTANAARVRQLIVFGDSYSDNGNTYRASQETYPGAAYSLGRFTNGPTWSEDLAAKLGIDRTDSRYFRNFAYGSAKIAGRVRLETHDASHSWEFTIPDLAGEIDEYVAEGTVNPADSLYTLFMGTNDIMSYEPSTPKANHAFVEGLLETLGEQVTRLESLGAKHVVVFDMRLLSHTALARQHAERSDPGLKANYAKGYIDMLDEMIVDFNKNLAVRFANDARVMLYSAYDFDKALINKIDAGGAEYRWYRSSFRLENDLDECYVNGGNYVERVAETCTKPESYFYYDRIHPSAYVHLEMARDLAKALKRAGVYSRP